jgi:hypothetical protein
MSDVGTKNELPEFLKIFQRHNDAYNAGTAPETIELLEMARFLLERVSAQLKDRNDGA